MKYHVPDFEESKEPILIIPRITEAAIEFNNP